MSVKGKRGAARDAARLRQALARVRTAEELRYFVQGLTANSEELPAVWRVCWDHSPLAAAGPAPEYVVG